MKRLIAYVLTAGFVLGGCSQPTPQQAGEPTTERGFYSSKTPYRPLQDWADYEAPPAGFQPVQVQHVARHGSRALSSLKYDDLTLQVWRRAKQEAALTELGRALGPAVQEVMSAHDEIGYGNLSRLGEQEHQDMAARMLQRLPGFFAAAAQSGRTIQVHDSGAPRAHDSAQSFIVGLVEQLPQLAPLIDAPVADPDRLRFDTSEAGQAFQRYRDEDPRLHAKLEELFSLPANREVARAMLERLYTPEFVDRLAAGDFEFADNGKGTTFVRDEVDAAYMLYNLYVIVPGMQHEAHWGFAQFITDEHAEWMAYLADAEDFYERGPGFAGDDITYRMADVLLDDMFAQVEQLRTNAAAPVATLRFSHAQALVPLATLLGLPDTEQLAEAVTYDYQTSRWRGETITPMAANVQWDVFANEEGRLLVRMLHQEREVNFRAGCTPFPGSRYYYEFEELERCYGRL